MSNKVTFAPLCMFCVLYMVFVFLLLFIFRAHVIFFIMVFSLIVKDGVSNILTSDIVRIRSVPLPNTDTQNIIWKQSSVQVKVS